MNFRLNELFFIALLTMIAIMNITDFIGDYREQSPVWHLAQEAFLVVASIGGIGYLLWEVSMRRREMEQVKQQLQQANSRLSESNEKLKSANQQYREVIDQQLTDWSLTPSEREVGLLLLKGLSFEEIAGVRETKEKTVRQQATAIYRKSGLNGRHEFAAWFFEDFLQ
ncbi:helix-turn-helix transcriptional regulator [Leucothrix pacifica]|uniref:Helix-turn-helix transcriptional regulator n=1 Tax=Leucothrix pacifica TaxID=1247513 RepID=A0A317CJR2_9GAMM|nr:LuxR C-terminal-related transcriptional regulator [Leucothrix pacifica]PWQ96560.1 helix-turn-helix transcriptional regulator [Leucothrix pacifica]